MFGIAKRGLAFSALLFIALFSVLTMTTTTAGAAMIYVRHMTAPIETIHLRAGAQTWTITTVVHWNWGHYGGDSAYGKKAWARPTEAWVTVNAPGSVEPCGVLDGYNGTDFTFTFSNPSTGYTFHGDKHKVGCAIDTTNQRWIHFSDKIARMHYVGLAPKWKAHIQVELDAHTDPTGTLSGSFHRK